MRCALLASGLSLLLLHTLARAQDAGSVSPWQPRGVSSEKFESHPAFDPLTGDFFFVRSSPAFEGWRILTSRCTAAGWSTPQSPWFAGDGVEADPWFTPDGRELYFISTRTTDGIAKKDLDLWRIERDANGRWATPERLPEPINSAGQEWFPRVAPDGWLYFGSDRAGGLGRTDIWRARERGGGWRVENAGPALNTAADEYEPLPSPDGRTLIVMAGDGLYRSELGKGGWTRKVRLGPEVNATGSEIGALFSPSGKSLLFARDLKERASGELFVWHLSGAEAWPPSCPTSQP
jgi:hypothetical protein